MKKIEKVLTKVNPGDHWTVNSATKIEILKQVFLCIISRLDK